MTVERFSSLVDELARESYQGVSLTDLLEPEAGDAEQKRIALTFDDGYRSVLDQALPILQRAGWGATLFVVTDFCGRGNQWPSQGAGTPAADLLNWEDIGVLAEAGWEIAPHTRSHHPLVELEPAEAEEEILSSQESVRARTGQPATVFAYPYGAVTESLKRFVSRHFRAAVGTRLGVAHSNSDLYDLERIDSYYLQRLRPRPDAWSFRTCLHARHHLRNLRRVGRSDWRWSV